MGQGPGQTPGQPPVPVDGLNETGGLEAGLQAGRPPQTRPLRPGPRPASPAATRPWAKGRAARNLQLKNSSFAFKIDSWNYLFILGNGENNRESYFSILSW